MARERAPMKATMTAEQFLVLHHAISAILADTPTRADGMPAILQALGTSLQWYATALWLPDQADPPALYLRACWPTAAMDDEGQRAILQSMSLPERVWHTGEVIWNAAAADGLDARRKYPDALRWTGAFPLHSHDATVGVITCFHDTLLPLDAKLQRALATLGNTVGTYIASAPVDAPSQQATDMTMTHLGGTETEAIFEALVDSVTVYDNAGKLVRANAAARELFTLAAATNAAMERPYSERAADYQLCDEWGQPLSRDRWPLQRLLDGEALIGANMAEIMLTNAPGHIVHLSVSGAPIFDAAQQITGAVMISRDVGVQRKLERQTHDTLQALLEMAKTLVQVSEADAPPSQPDEQPVALAKMRHIAAHMAEVTRRIFTCRHVSILAVDPQTDLLAPMAVAGLTSEQERQWWRQQPIGIPLDSCVNHADVQRFRAGEVVAIDMPQLLYNAFPQSFATNAIMVAAMKIGERIVGVLALDGGASRHYMSEEIELVGAVAKLAALVLERERLLSEREAARANELALGEANRRMDEFLSIASHELKTPLTSVKGYIQLAAHRLKRVLTTIPAGVDTARFAQFDQSLQGAIDLLMRSDHYSDVLNRLVTELLDVARIQSDTIAVYRAACDLNNIVTEAVKLHRLTWPARQIHLDIDAASDTAIHADAARIGQVITNLLTNAVNYSAADRHVTVTVRREEGHITVAVHDEGPGVAAEEQQRIWERFYRGTNQHDVGSGGLGIGLYLSRTIVEQHKGRIGVHSTVGVGSTFWFSLPLS